MQSSNVGGRDYFSFSVSYPEIVIILTTMILRNSRLYIKYKIYEISSFLKAITFSKRDSEFAASNITQWHTTMNLNEKISVSKTPVI